MGTETEDTKSGQQREWMVKALIWSIPVIFGAGALVRTVSTDDASLSALEVKLDATDEDLQEHGGLAGHPVSMTKIDHLATQQDEMMTEQRAMRTEQHEMAMDLAAICQATGADCSR